jgi:hypothetical protein
MRGFASSARDPKNTAICIQRARSKKHSNYEHGKTRLPTWVIRLSTEISGQEGNSARNTVSFGFEERMLGLEKFVIGATNIVYNIVEA